MTGTAQPGLSTEAVHNLEILHQRQESGIKSTKLPADSSPIPRLSKKHTLRRSKSDPRLGAPEEKEARQGEGSPQADGVRSPSDDGRPVFLEAALNHSGSILDDPDNQQEASGFAEAGKKQSTKVKPSFNQSLN